MSQIFGLMYTTTLVYLASNKFIASNCELVGWCKEVLDLQILTA